MLETQTRIKRLARKVLCDMAPDRDRMLIFRDYCWAMSDYLAECGTHIDCELRKKRRTNPKWKRDRPKPSEIRAEEDRLKSFIGHDVEKLELIETCLSFLSSFMLDPLKAQHMIEQASDSLNAKELQHAVRVFTRGKGGAHLKQENENVCASAYPLLLEGKTIDELARMFWLDPYRQNRSRTRNRMKAALYRYRKRLDKSAKHKNGDRIPTRIM